MGSSPREPGGRESGGDRGEEQGVVTELSDLEEARREVDDLAAVLEVDRRTADPARGVTCSRGCSERPCSHTAYLVEAIIWEER
jgi:hypothetical protein